MIKIMSITFFILFAFISHLTHATKCSCSRKSSDHQSSSKQQLSSQNQGTSFLGNDDIPLITMSFQKFTQNFHLSFSPQAKSYRRFIYYRNIAYINQFNSQDSTFKLYLNQYAALAPEQFSSHYATLLPQQAEYDEIQTVRLLEQSSQKKKELQMIDWSCFSGQVMAQGLCGSCYAFVTTDSLSAHHSIHLDSKFIQLSAQEIVSCQDPVLADGCQGGLLSNSYQYIQQWGIATQIAYPYQSLFAKEAQTCNEDKKNKGERYKITSYRKLKKNCEVLKDQLKKGPVAVGMSSIGMQFYRKGVFKNSPKTTTDHAVLLVGYDLEVGYKFKNNWGKTWGIAGYGWVDIEQHAGVCSRAYSIEIQQEKKPFISPCHFRTSEKLQGNYSQIFKNHHEDQDLKSAIIENDSKDAINDTEQKDIQIEDDSLLLNESDGFKRKVRKEGETEKNKTKHTHETRKIDQSLNKKQEKSDDQGQNEDQDHSKKQNVEPAATSRQNIGINTQQIDNQSAQSRSKASAQIETIGFHPKEKNRIHQEETNRETSKDNISNQPQAKYDISPIKNFIRQRKQGKSRSSWIRRWRKKFQWI